MAISDVAESGKGDAAAEKIRAFIDKRRGKPVKLTFPAIFLTMLTSSLVEKQRLHSSLSISTLGKQVRSATRDTVVFDEIANTNFTDPGAFVSFMQDFMQVIAFSDRIHGYLPGWEIPKLAPGSYFISLIFFVPARVEM